MQHRRNSRDTSVAVVSTASRRNHSENYATKIRLPSVCLGQGDIARRHPGREGSFVFTSPGGGGGWKLNKGKAKVIELVARSLGTYNFNCSVVCGIHHGRMRGQLIVEP